MLDFSQNLAKECEIVSLAKLVGLDIQSLSRIFCPKV